MKLTADNNEKLRYDTENVLDDTVESRSEGKQIRNNKEKSIFTLYLKISLN